MEALLLGLLKQELIGFLRRHWRPIVAVLVLAFAAWLGLGAMFLSVLGASGSDEGSGAACVSLGYAVDAEMYVPSGYQAPVPSSGDVPGFSLGEEEQVTVAQTIITAGQSASVPTRGLVVAIATALQESGLRNLDTGDLDSRGVFQQRPSQGWGTEDEVQDVDHAARAFFGGPNGPNADTATGVSSPAGLLDVAGWELLSITQAAQRVQHSAYPDAYAKWEQRAATIVASLTGTIAPDSDGDQLPTAEDYIAAGVDLEGYCAANFQRASAVAGYGPGPWGGFSNGQIPPEAMTALPWAPSHLLRPDAATAFIALNDAYRAEFGTDIVVTDSYRSLEEQVATKASWCARGACNMAATPGTSNHGWGLAVDLGGGINQWLTTQRAWMVANAPTFGWVSPGWAQPGKGKEEPWHWEYNPPATTPTQAPTGAA